MPGTSFVYRAAMRLGRLCLPAAALVQPKLRHGHAARAGVLGRVRDWAAVSRDFDRPLVWFHAPSVGEGLQADAVIRRLRALRPTWQIAYTFFSPSAEALARRLSVDVADYLPYDLPAAAESMLDLLKPDLLVFTKLDLWPELATRAARRGIPVSLIAGTVRPHSGRLGWPMARLLEPGYRSLALAAAIDAADGERLLQLGSPREHLIVAGDPRFDSVLDRVRAVPVTEPLLRLGRGAPTMVAGSTWPGDEDVLLDALARLQDRPSRPRLILAPHEPTEPRLREITWSATRRGLPPPERLSQLASDREPGRLLLIDRAGVLATLYGAGAMAYVGGGFHRAGLHSVLEPAAWGVPVAFGPRWQESRDATLLIDAGGAEAIGGAAPGSGKPLLEVWDVWLRDERRRATQGETARRVVEQGAGAAARLATALVQLVRRP